MHEFDSIIIAIAMVSSQMGKFSEKRYIQYPTLTNLMKLKTTKSKVRDITVLDVSRSRFDLNDIISLPGLLYFVLLSHS